MTRGDAGSVAELVELLVARGVRVTRVDPHEPTLEDLYFAVRGDQRGVTAPSHRRNGGPMNWHRMWTVARTDLKQLIGAKDFWVPMGILGGLFFLVSSRHPAAQHHSLGDVEAVQS